MQTVDKHTFLKGKNVNVPRSELALHTWPNHFALLKKGELMGQNEQQQAEIFKLRGHQFTVLEMANSNKSKCLVK